MYKLTRHTCRPIFRNFPDVNYFDYKFDRNPMHSSLSLFLGFEDTIEFCQVSGFIALFLACAAFHTIVAISQERLLLICYPLTARTYLTKNATWKILLSIWVVAFFSALPFPILFSYRVDIRLPNTTYRFCTIDIFRSNFNLGRYYYFFIFFVYYALPVIVVIISYARVFHALSSTSAYGRSSVKEEVVARTLRHRRSLAWMMVAVAVSFAAFEGPFFVTFLYFSLGFRFSRNHVFMKMVIDFLPILSSVVNPSVYLARAKTFKRSIGTASEVRTPRGLIRETKTAHGAAVTLSSGHQVSPGITLCSIGPFYQGTREILLTQCSHVLGATTQLARPPPPVAAVPLGGVSVQGELGSTADHD